MRWMSVARAAALACVSLFAFATPIATAQPAQPIEIVIDPAQEGPVINRHIFGQFAEHLGRGIYEGIWVGPDSPIPNTRGIRNDVVAALRAIRVPNVRWPGGCYADSYHWRDGIGPQRRTRVNASWGGVIDPNTFGTHEFFDFLGQIGAEPFVSVNMGSGTVQEAADWLEYMTAEDTSYAQERAANGRAEPWGVPFVGMGNETWGCGGPFTAADYATQLKYFAHFTRNYNADVPMMRIAVGPDMGCCADYTRAVMQEWSRRDWTWSIEGLSLHNYTRNGWPPNIDSFNFDESGYASVLEETLRMDQFIRTNAAIMDEFDPEKTVAIFVDEWGTWYEALEGTNSSFLEQQNSQRDAVLAALNFNIFARHADRVRAANIAQMINVLQAMILTRQEQMILTPTYHSFRLYVPFQNATRLGIQFQAGEYRHDRLRLPRVDAIAARGEDGKIYLALTNVDPNRSASFSVRINRGALTAARGDTLAAPAFNSVNTFEAPNTVTPRPINVRVENGVASVEVAPASVTVIALN